MVAALAQLSGAHFNPAITAGFWVTKRMGTLQSILYCVAQMAGAIAAAYILARLLPESIWRPVGLGATDLVTDFTRMQAMLLEALGTFFVVFVFFACTQQTSGSTSPYAGIGVGLTIAMDVLVLQPFTGASMNPARSFRAGACGSPLDQSWRLLGWSAVRRCGRRFRLRSSVRSRTGAVSCPRKGDRLANKNSSHSGHPCRVGARASDWRKRCLPGPNQRQNRSYRCDRHSHAFRSRQHAALHRRDRSGENGQGARHARAGAEEPLRVHCGAWPMWCARRCPALNCSAAST